ncbi:MAG: HVO_0234 family beta-propeller protein [Natronomonas sp.]
MAGNGNSIDEKRVFSERVGKTRVFVATEVGLVSVAVAGDAVGEFRLDRQGAVVDISCDGKRVAVATDQDVYLAKSEAVSRETRPEAYEPTGFGPATGVDLGSDGLVAAGHGRVARFDGEWTTLGSIREVRTLDADVGLVAARSGVHSLDGKHVGLENAFDVAVGPTIATNAGLYRLANGWVSSIGEPVRTVAIGDEAGFAGGEELYEQRGEGWVVADGFPTSERIADVAVGPATYVVTEPGTFLINDGDGWRKRSLGTPGVNAIAIRP